MIGKLGKPSTTLKMTRNTMTENVDNTKGYLREEYKTSENFTNIETDKRYY